MTRLSKYVAKALNVSRKEARELIREGKVKVDGKVIRDPDAKVKEGQKVEFEGEKIEPKEKIYLMLNKPKGYLSTTEREADYPSFLELIEDKIKRKVFSAGRLDVDARGLLIITDDGDLAHRLTHPKWKVEKEYIVKLDKDISEEDIKRLYEIEIDGKKVDIKEVQKISGNEVKIVIREGRHHIIKRLFKSAGFKVEDIKRVRMGNIKLDESLKEGEWRELSEEEINELRRLVKLS